MRHSTNNPEFMALAEQMERRDKLLTLRVDLERQEKITQEFLRRFLHEILDAWFELSEKTEMALNASGKHREIAAAALVRADNALRATDVVLEMGKLMGDRA